MAGASWTHDDITTAACTVLEQATTSSAELAGNAERAEANNAKPLSKRPAQSEQPLVRVGRFGNSLVRAAKVRRANERTEPNAAHGGGGVFLFARHVETQKAIRARENEECIVDQFFDEECIMCH